MITLTPLSVPWAPAQSASASVTLDGAEAAEEVERPKALAYLLDIDDVRILLGAGAPESLIFELSRISAEQAQPAEQTPEASGSSPRVKKEPEEEVEEQAPRLEGEKLARRAKSEGLDTLLLELAPSIDLVLLCHSTLSHIGLYAWAWARLGLRCPAFASLPTATMGRLTTLEAADGWRDEMEATDQKPLPGGWQRCVPTRQEVDEAFDSVRTVRYLQPTQLDGKCAGVILTAYAAGHSLGGTLWKIRSPTAGTLLLALDWNHMRERHLDGTALIASPSAGAGAPPPGSSSAGALDAVRRADVLVTDVERSLVVNARRKDRDAALLDIVHNTIRAGHSVLLPVDASARLLELLVLLDAHWAFAYPHARFPLCLVSRTGKELLERARALMEWTTKSWATQAGEQADEGRGRRGDRNEQPSNPLEFKYLRIFSSLAALDEAVPQDAPKVVLAVPLSATHGSARALLARAAKSPGDAVILTQRGDPGSLSRWLYEQWEALQDANAKWGKASVGKGVVIGQSCDIQLHLRVPLEGEELAKHNEAERLAAERAATQQALRARTRRRLEADEEADESDSDDSDASSAAGDEGAGEGGETYAEPGSGRKRKREGAGAMGGENAEGAAGGASDLSFDVYLRGAAGRATTFFGAGASGGADNAGRHGTGVRYRMFPFIERKRRVDAYGETIDVARWLSRRREIEASRPDGEGAPAGERAETAEARKRRLEKEEKEKEGPKAPPSKIVSHVEHLSMACQVAFIDMSGLTDGRALKTLLPQLLPRRLLLVGGARAARNDALKAFAAVRGMTSDIYAPALGDVTRIGELTNAYTLHLGEGLMGALRLSAFEDYEVAHLRATVRYAAESAVPTLEPLAQALAPLEAIAAQAEAADATDGAVVRTRRERPASDLAPTLFIGDLHLSTLKAALATQHRMASEFAGEGSLVCGTAAAAATAQQSKPPPPGVTVRKESEGTVVIEGNVGRAFYAVRSAVYGMHARVEGA